MSGYSEWGEGWSEVSRRKRPRKQSCINGSSLESEVRQRRKVMRRI